MQDHTLVPLVKPVQPAEDQKIENAFGHLELFIKTHIEQFYDVSIPLPGVKIFDFEPAGAAGTKAALRRYIARNVFQIVKDDTVPRSEDECRAKLLSELEPYTSTDSDQKDKWRKHLEDILKQGTALAQMLSSQHETKWQIGNFYPATTKPPNVIDVLVFPSLFKDGREVRAEKKLRGTKKPKPRLATASKAASQVKSYFKRRNSIDQTKQRSNSQHAPTDLGVYEEDPQTNQGNTHSRRTYDWLRALLQDRDWGIVEQNPEPTDTSRNLEEEPNLRPDSQPFMSLNLKLDKFSPNDWRKFPESDWSNWGSILEQIRQSAGNATMQSSGKSTKKTRSVDDINPADQHGSGTRPVRRNKTI